MIDAQTISTYDSNQEHNGLYRNYQHAWENLRFSAPGSQPKSSGGGGGGGGLGHLQATAGGPTTAMMALKNYTSPNVAVLHHAHPIHTSASAVHHQLGASSASTSSSSSHSSSSVNNSGGDDPLLGNRHQAHHYHHTHAAATAAAVAAGHHHHRHQLAAATARHHHEEPEDDDDDEDHGVVTEDELGPYPSSATASHQMHAMGAGRMHQRRSHHDASSNGHMNEGFRDSNELTINADTASMGGGRSLAAVASNRRQSASGVVNNQRLSASSSSTARSSGDSPDELDRLAYGNNWPSSGQAGASQLMR